jgi:hypothetical protein
MKLKLINQGRLSNSELENVIGGANSPCSQTLVGQNCVSVHVLCDGGFHYCIGQKQFADCSTRLIGPVECGDPEKKYNNLCTNNFQISTTGLSNVTIFSDSSSVITTSMVSSI